MSNDADHLGTLEAAILIQHQCKATHKETVFVKEKTVDGELIWQGRVDSFELIGHKEARTCYAWQHIDAWGNAKIFAVLANNFIDSPKRAVQAAIFVGSQPSIHRFSKELELLKQHLAECRRLSFRMRIKAEDLAAATQTWQGIREAVNRKRNKAA